MIRALLTGAMVALMASAASAQSCDADCMSGIANRYMDAVVKHDPRGLPWAERVGYAEHGTKLRVGEGSWVTIDKRSTTPLVVADPETGHVVWVGGVEDHGQPAFYAMDMSIARGRIAAVSKVIRRKEGRPPFGDPTAFKHDGKFDAKVARSDGTARASMVALVEGYLNSQAASNGAVLTSIGADCRLIENGLPMTGNLPAGAGEDGGCAAGLERRLYQEFEAVRRKVVAVDEGKGLVAAIGYRDLPGATTSFTARDGKAYPAEANYPRSVAFVSVFKIEGGKITRIETVANEVPYLMPFPWKD